MCIQYHGVCSVLWENSMKNVGVLNIPTALMILPHVTEDPHGTQDNPTVLSTPHGTHDIRSVLNTHYTRRFVWQMINFIYLLKSYSNFAFPHKTSKWNDRESFVLYHLFRYSYLRQQQVVAGTKWESFLDSSTGILSFRKFVYILLM